MYNSLSYKTKQFFWLLIKLSIVIGCFYFIYQKLTTNNELSFPVLIENLTKNNVFEPKNVFLLLFLSFLNWYLEITKWKKLVSFISAISFKEATKQSLASLTTSLITPNRIGEYGAKAMYFKKTQRKKIMGLNFVGNFYQMMATITFGSIGFTFFVFTFKIEIDFIRIFLFLLLGVFIISTLFLGAKHYNYKGFSFEKVRSFITQIPFKLNVKIGLFSFFRFAIFSHQFYFLIVIFGIQIPYIIAISAIASVYFISSIVPMLSLFDVVLKSTVAIWIFSTLKIDVTSILTITTLMWILNFVIPAVIGSYFVIIYKPNILK